MSATATSVRTTDSGFTVSVPTQFNGYVSVAQPARMVPPFEVKKGDILLLGNLISQATADARPCTIEPHGGTAYFIAGQFNIVRFAHEQVWVIR